MALDASAGKPININKKREYTSDNVNFKKK